MTDHDRRPSPSRPPAGRRWPRRLALALLGSAVGGALLVGLWLRRSLPGLEGRLQVKGLTGPVSIRRDGFGVPTISASSFDDALFGLGFVHAQDRLFQMELSRRAAGGRLSELVGRDMVETDTWFLKLALPEAAQSAVSALREDTRRALAAYSAGVNAAASRQAPPPEIDVLRALGATWTWESWSATDSALVAKLLAQELSMNAEEEWLYDELRRKLDRARLHALFPHVRGQRQEEGLSAGPWLEGMDGGSPSPHAGRPGPTGSNAWAVSGRKTASGYPLLASDPHVELGNPTLFYTAVLEIPGLRLEGVSVPGIPAMMVGRNQHIAWGATNLMADTQDLFFERGAIRTRKVKLQVRGEATPVELTIERGSQGPIVAQDWMGQGKVAMRWPALDDGDTSIEAFIDLGRAENWSQARAALSLLWTPALRFVYADADGHIAAQVAGRLPIRPAGAGLGPLPGSAPFLWTGYQPFEGLPSTLDPPDGVVVSANEAVGAPDYPYLISSDFDPPYRAGRIRALLAGQSRLTDADMAKLQADRHSTLADSLLPVLEGVKADGPREEQALALLRGWNRDEGDDSPAPALFIAWYVQLLPLLLRDELGDAGYPSYAGHRTEALLHAFADPDGVFCDDHGTPGKESCAALAHSALRLALADLEQRLGPRLETWRQGELLRLKLANPVGSELPLLGRLFTRDLGVPGDPFTVRVSHFVYREPYRVTDGSACFATFDLQPDGGTRIVLPLGESGHPLSPHFDDQLAHWSATHPLPTRSAFPAVPQLDLLPAP